MSKTLRQGEYFLKFLLDPHTHRKQIRHTLLNCTAQQLEVLTEIFHNLLKNQNNLPTSFKKLIKKRKRLITKFVSLFKKNKFLHQRKYLSSHMQTILNILLLTKNILFKYFL